LVGSSSVTIEFGQNYTDPGATFTDNVDGNGTVIAQESVNGSILGQYVLTYQKTDAAGNVSNTVTRTITVVDTTNPVIVLNGSSTVTLEVGTAYTELGATFTDNVDANGNASVSGTVNNNVLGTYTMTYTYTDSSNNTGSSTRTVNVVDTTAPVLDILGSINYKIGDGIPSIANFVTAIDAYDGNVISSLSYTFNIGDYLSPGTYALTLTVSDSSGNTTSSDITIEVVQGTVEELAANAITMLAGLANLFTVTPEKITLTQIGNVYTTIPQIDNLTGNGYMADGDIIYSNVFNSVTAPEYIQIVETYNSSLSTMNSYLAVVLPLLAHITSYETEYTYGGFTFFMTKVNNVQYQITINGTVFEQPVQMKIVVDELSIIGEYVYSIEFSTSFATWHYSIYRSLLRVNSIIEIIEFLGESNGIVYANGFLFDGDDLSGFILKDEANVTRRLYFEFTDTQKGIYYLNDDTGTEKYISLDTNGELVFEYENYQPNIPFVGTEKVRWSLDQLYGMDSIEYDKTIFTSKFIIDNTTNIYKSDFFDIEAKNYSTYLYDSVNNEYYEETTGCWMLRMEGSLENDFDLFFNFQSPITPLYMYNVKQQIQDLMLNKNSLSIFGIDVLSITKEEIMIGLE
ncbi:MAG: DUF5011 domain-containing protein, partial [Firmicutes bacterium]|nr:DUF5011 domain-containing protein [Bacillota bacterium]